MHKILVIDDDAAICKTLKLHLSSGGAEVETATALATGRKIWIKFQPDLVLLDITLPDGDGIGLLSEASRRKLPGLVVMITGNQELEKATEAMRCGAYDYLLKPLDIDKIDAVVDRVKHFSGIEPDSALVITETDPYVPGRIAGKSKSVLELHKQIGLAARCYANAIITGETGVGKEMVAKAIHKNSGSDGPFVAVNCSAIVATLTESELFGHEKGAFTGATSRKIGQFEAAGNGTIFLDEIGDMSLEMQVKLLRVLQEREFRRVGGMAVIPLQARVIAATHRNLKEMVIKGEFREDLYYRLNVMEIRVPPLRERKEDIPILVQTLLRKINVETRRYISKVSRQTLKILQDYDWPGNIRELEHRLTAAAIRSSGENLEFIPPAKDSSVAGAVDYNWNQPLLEVEKNHIQEVMSNVSGHLGRACEILGISRPTLRKKIKDYGLKDSFNME